MGQAGRDFVQKNFSVEVMIDRINGVYKDLVMRPGRGGSILGRTRAGSAM